MSGHHQLRTYLTLGGTSTVGRWDWVAGVNSGCDADRVSCVSKNANSLMMILRLRASTRPKSLSFYTS